MISPRIIILLALTAAFTVIAGFSCSKRRSTGDYFSSLTSYATWPHTGAGITAQLNPVPDVCVAEPNGRGPAGYKAVVASVNDWNKALGRTVLTVAPDGTSCQGSKIIVNLSAPLDQSAPPGTSDSVSAPTYAYTNATLVGGTPADGQKGGTLAHADVYVYGFDSTDAVEGVMNHELGRCLGAIAGVSSDRADVLYSVGTHGKPSTRDVATLEKIYSQ